MVRSVNSDSSISLWRCRDNASREGVVQSQCPDIETVFWRRIPYGETGHHSKHTWGSTVRVWKVINSSVIFSGLSVVRYRNVELTMFNKALLGRQPMYCEIPSSFEFALFSVFLIAFRYNFHFWTSNYCLFLMCL